MTMTRRVCYILLFLSSALPVKAQEVSDSLRNKLHYYYMADKSYEELLDLFNNGNLKPSDNYVTFEMLSKIVKDTPETRDLAAKTLLQISLASDGAVSEVLGSYLLDFIESKPNDFYDAMSSSTEREKTRKTVILLTAFEVQMSDTKERLQNMIDELVRKELSKEVKEYVTELLMQIKATHILLE